MRIIDKALLKSYATMPRCEWCARFRSVVGHHIYSKGAGRVDIRENLIGLCLECHGAVHDGHIVRADLLAVAAQREGLMQQDITAEVYRARRLPKGSVYVPFAGQRPVPLVGGDQPREVPRGPHRPRSFGGAQGVETDEGWQAFGDV